MQQNMITGICRSDTHFTTVMAIERLRQLVISGLEFEDAAKMKAEGHAIDPRVEELLPFREGIQRQFLIPDRKRRSRNGVTEEYTTYTKTPKHKNATGPLKQYIMYDVAPVDGPGVVPPFVLIIPEPMESHRVEANIPGMANRWYNYDASKVGRGILGDGESRFLAIDLALPLLSPADQRSLLAKEVTVEVWHGVTRDRAAQMFVDYHKSVAVTTTQSQALDPRDRWSNCAKEVFEKLDIKLGTSRRQITTSNRLVGEHIVIGQAIDMVRAVHYGSVSRAVNKSKTKDWEPEKGGPADFEKLTKACTKWFGEIFDYFGGIEVLSDDSKVVRAGPVRLALATLGQAHYTNKLEDAAAASNILREVNWTVIPAWNNIAGAVTAKPDGNGGEIYALAVASPKQTGSMATSAICNFNPPGKPGGEAYIRWHAIRGLKPREGQS